VTHANLTIIALSADQLLNHIMNVSLRHNTDFAGPIHEAHAVCAPRKSQISLQSEGVRLDDIFLDGQSYAGTVAFFPVIPDELLILPSSVVEVNGVSLVT